MTRRARTIAGFAAAYFALTVAYTWPLAARLGAVAHDIGDPVLNAWILWWSGTQAVPLTARWWNPPAFLPAVGVLALSEHLLGLAPIAAPVIALTGNALAGYNVALLATFLLSALGAHFLAYTLTRRHDASFIAALAFAFAPYRLAQLPHIQVLSSYWAPVCLAALHRYTASARPAWAIAAAAAWLLQALACGYYLFFLSVLLPLWLLWFAVGRWSLRQWITAAAAFGAAAVLLLPFLLGYQHILQDTYGFRRSIGEVRVFSADIASLLSATPELLAWRWVRVFERPEGELFPGLTIVVLAIAALARTRPFATAGAEARGVRLLRAGIAALFVLLLAAAAVPIVYGPWRLTIAGARVLSIARADKPISLALVAALALLALLPRVRGALARRSPLAFYAAAAFAMWVCALGPDPTLLGHPAIYEAPYRWLTRLPGFDGLRVPARFWMMALLCLSAVAALAVDRLHGRARRACVAIAAAGLLIDGWPRGFIVLDAPQPRPSPAAVVTRLDLPISSDTDVQALYQQTMDGVPLHNGFSGYFPPHYFALRTTVEQQDPRILHVLAARGPLGVIIDHAGDPDGLLRRFVLAYPGATKTHDEASWSSYRLPQSANPPSIPDVAGTPLTIRSLATFPSAPHAERAHDGNLITRWSGGLQQRGAEAVAEAVIELERPSYVGQVVIDLGGYITDFPVRLQIEVSADGRSWETAWTGATALHAYFGAVRHPREIPLVFELHRDGVRFIRLRQIGFGTHDWSIPELRVLGR